MANVLRVCGAFLCAMVFAPTANASVLSFQCSWDQKAPITISVDTNTMTASRDDGGKPYRVVKVSKWGVWLLVDEPANVAGAAVQMIVRPAALAGPDSAGKWIDVVIGITGAVSPIDGGMCWEK
jgi:hypothetical protein